MRTFYVDKSMLWGGLALMVLSALGLLVLLWTIYPPASIALGLTGLFWIGFALVENA